MLAVTENSPTGCLCPTHEEQIVVRQLGKIAEIVRVFAAESRIMVVPSQELLFGRQFGKHDTRSPEVEIAEGD